MARKNPFIISWQLEELSPGLPFVIKRMEAGENENVSGETHRHEYYAIGICREGGSTHMIDFERIELQPKDMMLIVPGQVHNPVNIQKGSSGWLIAFAADFLAGQSVTLPLSATGKITLSADDFIQAVTITQLIEKEYKAKTAQYIKVLQHYVSVLITLLQRNTNTIGFQTRSILVFRYRELLATHFLQWTKPIQYADALHISANHLNEVVKQHTGQTATSLIAERRLLEAKRLLLHAGESIKEIAWHLQFNEVSYFNKFFKQHTGCTPAAFRNSLREKWLFIPE